MNSKNSNTEAVNNEGLAYTINSYLAWMSKSFARQESEVVLVEATTAGGLEFDIERAGLKKMMTCDVT